MEFPETREREVSGQKIQIKPYLTFAEVQNVVIACVNVYDNGVLTVDDDLVKDEIPNFNKNILYMERNFHSCLIELCTDLEDYDYDILVACDFISDLYDIIINAESTLQKIYDIIEKRDNIESAIGRGFEQLVTKIPTPKELQGLYSSVKKDILSGKLSPLLDRFKDVFDINKAIKGE